MTELLPAEVNERWQARFRATRVSLPDWAEDAPQRNLYVSNATGVFELFAWDRETGTHRQVTDRKSGTYHGTVDPTGEEIWWFADTDGDEWGVWMRQPFGGGPDAPAIKDLEPSYPSGLEIGHTTAIVGGSTDDGASIHVADLAGGDSWLLYRSADDAHVGAMSKDETLVAISHSEHGDSRHMALRVLSIAGDDHSGQIVAEKWDGDGKGLSAAGFSAVAGDQRLLVSHERRGKPELLIWDPVADTETEILLDLPGEIGADWYTDGTALLISHDYAARAEIYRYDLSTESLERVETPAGVVRSATARPDGTVELSWSSSAQPSVIRSAAGETVLEPAGDRPPAAYPVEDAWVDGPGGKVHALVVRPPAGEAPYAAVFSIHGGPESLDSDSFSAHRAAWADAGYAVIHVNYRGSEGYGSVWRDALTGRPGLTELEDIAAVHDWAVSSGLVDGKRTVLSGASWGGYLTLLGLGTQPDRWTVGIAGVPVADYVAAYADEMEGLRAFDRALFGGSPEDLPDSYERSSPITYVDQVRAPVLVLAGANDPRCPIRQIDNYLERLSARDAPHEVYRFDAGHGSLVVEEMIRQTDAEIDFALRHVHPDAVADEEEIPLLGGDVTEGVVRVGNTVRRPAKPTSPAIQSLLRHLEAAGFDGAPVALGYDSRGRETLSYVDGDSPGRPHPAYAVTDEALASVARLLRRFHEAAAGFVPPPDAVWHLPPQNVPGTPPPAPDVPELVGHRDITPENVVFRDGAAYALIDFDMAGPTTRVLEVVNTLRYWAPFRAPQDRDPSWTDVDAAARARIFCDAYGLSFEDRPAMVDRAELGLAKSWHLMKAAAERDGGGWARMWEDGVGDVLLRASAWLAVEKPRLVATLTT